MIRIKRTLERYATRVDISTEISESDNIIKSLKKESIKNINIPKNTLRVLFYDKMVGFDGDGFVRNIKTIIFYYKIVTFKR